MSDQPKKSSFFEKLATFIVDKRNLIFFLYAIAIFASLITQSWVSVCNDLTEYLPETTETRRGLTLMEDEMKTYGTARIIVSHVTYEIARDLADQIEDLNNISSVDFWDADKTADDTTLPSAANKTYEDYMQGADALITVTFRGENDDQSAKDGLAAVKELLAPYDTYISTDVGYSKSETLNEEMGIILVVAALVIVLVLLLTSRSYAEVPVLLLTFVAAALLNKGTNFIFGEISFVSDSVTVVLQLALAIDYSIILLHRFLEEREHAPDDRTACIIAVSAAIPSISASSLTTISGLAAMMFMQFRIGFDLGLVLIKAILLSMLAVFTLMPGLLMLFSKAMERTRHKNFIPQIDRWGKLVYALRHVGVPVFIVCVIGGFVLSNQCPYVYGDNAVMTVRRNEHQAATDRVENTFGTQNIMAIVVPKGDTASEKIILQKLSALDEVDYAMGLSNVEAKPGYCLTDQLTPRQFSEMMGLSYEEACILYAAYTADQEDNYGPIVGGIDSYTVSAMDMILFIYQEKEKGYVTLDDDDEKDIDDAYQQITAEETVVAAAPVYRWLTRQTPGVLRQLEREFVTDDHRLWPKDAPDQPQQMPTPLPQKTWQKIGERMQTELDLRDKEAGDGADALKQQVKAANRSRRSYRDFLRRFCVLREEVKLDPDEFDLNFYTYGLSVYGNLPLIEPLESRESKKIEELALVIDTSYSTSGELVRAFLAETYTLLKGQENFFHRMNLHLIQADNAIRQDILIHNEDELIHAMNHFELRGGGGTDFRPAFEYVNQLCAEKKFSNLRGLLYFTDGMGTYPAKRPAYDTAFLFLGERFDDANVPPWAMKVVLDEEEFTGAAARPQSTLADALAEEDDLYRDLNNS